MHCGGNKKAVRPEVLRTEVPRTPERIGQLGMG